MIDTLKSSRFIRFAAVGAGFSLGYALLTAFLVGPLSAPPFVTSVVLYALCIPLAYLAQKHFTFGQETTHKGSFAIYGATQVVSLAVVATLSTRFVTQVYWLDTGLFLTTAASAAIVSYGINRSFAFTRSA
jgi:putative flippase GtrA